MNHSMRIIPALALVFVVGGCSSMNHDTNRSEGQMHRADADADADCAPDRIGSAAGQGTNCRNGTGGARTTPPDSSNSNEPGAPTSPPR